MTTPFRHRRRELERELADVPTPQPPAGLLDEIRNEIPADLRAGLPAPAPRAPWHQRPLLRLAASLAAVAVGLSIALQVIESGQDRDEKLPLNGKTDDRAAAAPEASSVAVGETSPSLEVAVSPKRVVVESARDKNERLPLKRKTADLAAAALEASSVTVGETSPSMEVSGGRERGGDVTVRPRESAAETVTITSEAPLLDARRTAPEARRKESGGREPLDRVYGDMFFRGAGTNPFVDTAEDRLSTFAPDVDTGSWTLARSYLERGALPPAEAIRVEELVNAQAYDDPAPRRGDFTLVAEGAPSPFAPEGEYRLVRFAVQGREIDLGERRPAHLTFVVDVSGSMRRENRLELVKRALQLLVDELGRDDRVALAVYGTRGRVLLPPTRDLDALREAIDTLRPEGSTNAEEGLRLGYDLAGEMYRPGAANRVILCSDGVANVGATGPESILETIGREARRGIELTTVGFGMGNYNDALMEQLADQGDGRYHYVDTLEEARRIFVENLAGTLETIAKDAKVQVEFDPATVERWRLFGYENRDVADRDFRNDRVDAGELGAGHSAVALYEIRLAPRARPRDRLATLRLRWQSPTTRRVEEAALDLHVRDLESGFRRASHNLRRAAIAAEFAEMLKRSFYAKEASWRTLVDEAYRLERDRADPRAMRKVSDLTELIERAAALAERREPSSQDPPGEE